MLFIMYLLIFGCFDLLSSENRKEEIIFDGDTIVVTQSDATEKCFYYKYHDYFKVCERKALCFDIKNFFYLSRPLRQILDFKNNKELSERSLLEIFESFQQHIVGPSANHLASKIEFVLTLDNFKGNDKEDLLRQGVVYLEIIVEDFLCACLKDNLLFYVQTDRGFALSNDTQELLQGMIKQKIDKSFEKIIENKDFSLEECDKKKLIVRDLLSKSEEIFVGDANRLDLEDLSEFKHSLQNDLVKKYFNSNALVEKVMKNEKSKEQQDLRLSQLYIEGKERARKISENEQKEKEIEERKKKAVLNRLAREEQLRKKEEEKKRLQESRNKEKEQQNIASSQNGTNLQKTRQDLLEKFRLLNRGLLDIEEVSSKSISQDNQSLLNNTKKLIEEKRTEVNNSSSKKDGLKAFQTKLESLQQEYDKLSIDVAKIKELLKSINNEHQQEPQTTIENDASHEQYNDQNISSSLVDGLVKFNVAVSTAANARLLMDTKNKIDQQKQGPKEPSSKTKQVSFVENTEKLKDNVIIHNQNFNRNSSSCTCLNQNSAVLGNAQDCVHCCIIQHKMSLMADDDIQLAESDASSGLQARSNLATNVVVLAPILTTRGQAEQLNNLNSLTNSCMGMRENPHVYSESCHKQRSVKKISNLGAAFYPDDYMTKKEAESCHKQRSVKKISNLGAAFYPDDYMTKKEAEAVNNR